MNQIKAIIIPFMILITISIACSKTDYPQQTGDVDNLPDSQLDDATIILTRDGRKSVLVKAVHIDRWEKNDSTEADTVEITFCDTDGNKQSILTANRCLIREKKEVLALFGNVVGTAQDSTVLTTESLFWNPETRLITTDDYVEIHRPDGDILTGWGLKADRNLKNIEILKDVAGTVKKIPEAEKAKFEKK